MRIVCYLFAILLFSACETRHDIDNTVPIYYDYEKGYLVDTLTTKMGKNSFSNTIDSIERVVVDLTSYSDVFLSKEFIRVYESAEDYINNVLIYLADQEKSRQERTIALLTMQKRNWRNNLNFLYAVNYLYRQGLVEGEMIYLILFPIALDNRDIIKNYKAQQIRKVLLDIKGNKRTSKDLQNTIDDILSGKAFREQRRSLAEQHNIKI